MNRKRGALSPELGIVLQLAAIVVLLVSDTGPFDARPGFGAWCVNLLWVLGTLVCVWFADRGCAVVAYLGAACGGLGMLYLLIMYSVVGSLRPLG